MGRAIVRQPQVFCMDEPLSNLDAKMRVQTRTDIAKLQADLGVTTVYVTHDQVEAMTMGDRVAVMKDGYLQQVDTPLGLYDKPVNLFVAGFIGSPADEPPRGARRRTARPRSATTSCRSTRPRRPRWQGNITVGVRPEAWRMVGDSEDGHAGQGDRGRGPRLRRLRLRHQRCRGHAQQHHHPGQRSRPRRRRARPIYVTTDPQNVHVFDTESGERLSD